jgi:GAF domain-containing protein
MRTTARWVPGPMAADEAARVAAVRALGMLDTEPEERFDRITRLATAMFNVPVALITLIDEDRQWFKSAHGFGARETPRDVAFCTHAIYNGMPLVVPDALADDRFAENPVVSDGPRVRFYAGYPLTLDNGACVGTLCVVDTRPHDLDDVKLALLGDLAAMATAELQRPSETEG